MNEPEVLLPYIPESVTVHLGSPYEDAPNVTVSFLDYVKNVASSEIYPTWPENALRANILAQISFILNRIYTEYYRSRGYDFDVTNSTAIDQSFIYGRDIFENISRLVDELFNQYIRRRGAVEPLFAAYCDGVEVQCNGLSQWGSVELANLGYTPYEILQYYFGSNIDIVQDVPVEGVRESYPGVPLRLGTVNNAVRTLQIRLNRISKNFPSIPKIPQANGIFDGATEDAVIAFQRTFDLSPDGVVGPATWYRIAQIYSGVKRLSDLNSEGVPIGDVTNLFLEALRIGSMGTAVRDLQYYLAFIAEFNEQVPSVAVDGIFGSRTRAALEDFQSAYGLPVTGEANLDTWRALYDAYRGYLASLPPNYFATATRLYPGIPLLYGSSGEDVRALQDYLNLISDTYTEIPKLLVDGDFGMATADAVRAFQSLFGLEENGIVTAGTWNDITDTYRSLYEGRYGSPTQYNGYGAYRAEENGEA